MTRARITITLPESVLRATDERAGELDRSRSRVVAEALRRYLERQPETEPPAALREPAPTAYGPPRGAGLGPQRRTRLEADLALTPEQRVEEAERAARVAELRAPRWRRERVITFDRYEDYLDWERREDLQA
jgi:Arc/MetJ-type ribon-helix-helix transcriptional regulator